jgi:threonine/homoserine/homoserine lactone efflux protein
MASRFAHLAGRMKGSAMLTSSYISPKARKGRPHTGQGPDERHGEMRDQDFRGHGWPSVPLPPSADVVAVAFGVGALVERSAEIFTIVKWAGAGYLVYLGVQAIRHRQSMTEALAARAASVRPLRALRDGFVVGVTNPKSIVIFVVALPQFTDRAAGHLPVQAQMLILGALFTAIALVLDSVWAVIAGTARQWFARSPRRLALIGGTGGLVMIGLGVSLAATGRNDLSRWRQAA